MKDVSIVQTGVVFRGEADAEHLRNAAFPSIAQLANQDIHVTMTIGRERNSTDVRCYQSTSTDNGGTWSQPRKIFEPPPREFPISAGIRMTKAHDDTLIGYVNLLNRRDPEGLTTNRETGGTVEKDHAMIRSTDGVHWSELEPFEFPLPWRCYGEPSGVLALSATRWLLPSLTRLDWSGQCPLGLKSFVLISRDQGRNWDQVVDVFDLWGDEVVTWEQKHAQLSDGRILAVTWAFDTRTKTDLVNRYALSEDEGGSYSNPPFESPLNGQTCTPLALADNHILCVYRRLDQAGLWAHLARIQGDEWIPLRWVCLWGSDREAIAGGADSSIQSQHALQFGYPQLVRLVDGDVLVVFWAVEDGVSVIRWIRVQLHP